MKKLLKNRIVLGLSCIIISLLICFGLTPMFNRALQAKTTIVRVDKDITKGEEISADMLSIVEVGAYNLPINVVYTEAEVIGKYAGGDFAKGDYILASKVSDTPMLKNEYLSKLNGENRAISITIKSFAAGLSDKLERGDIISLIVSDVGEMRETVIPPELVYVEVIAVTDGKGMDHDGSGQLKEEWDAELASTITVLVLPEQARLLALYEQTGKLHAALVYRGTDQNAEAFLQAQQKVIDELYDNEIVEGEEDAYETDGGHGESE